MQFGLLRNSVLGANNMPLIIYQIMKNLDMKITNVLGPYVKALAEGFPERTSEYAQPPAIVVRSRHIQSSQLVNATADRTT